MEQDTKTVTMPLSEYNDMVAEIANLRNGFCKDIDILEEQIKSLKQTIGGYQDECLKYIKEYSRIKEESNKRYLKIKELEESLKLYTEKTEMKKRRLRDLFKR